MKDVDMSDEEFFKKYEAFDKETIEDFIKKFSRSENELHDTIDYLICHREKMRDSQLKELEAKSQELIDILTDINRQKVLEEIECFKDSIALQKRLLQGNDNS